MKCLQMFLLPSLKGLKEGLKKGLRRLDFRKNRLQVCFKPKGLAMDYQSLLKGYSRRLQNDVVPKFFPENQHHSLVLHIRRPDQSLHIQNLDFLPLKSYNLIAPQLRKQPDHRFRSRTNQIG